MRTVNARQIHLPSTPAVDYFEASAKAVWQDSLHNERELHLAAAVIQALGWANRGGAISEDGC